jgi:hypothetical protein
VLITRSIQEISMELMVSGEQTLKPFQAERGQSLLEVAISLPIIILLLVGTLNFGMAIFTFMTLRDAAQEGALYASFDPSHKAAIESRARGIHPESADSSVYSPVDLNDRNHVKVEVKIIGDDCQAISSKGSNSVQVSVSYEYPLFMPFADQIFGSSRLPLTARATNVILQPPCQ